MERKPQTTKEAFDNLDAASDALWTALRESSLPTLLFGVWLGMAIVAAAVLLTG